MKYTIWLVTLLLFAGVGCKKESDVTSITGIYNQEFKTAFLSTTKHQINFTDGSHFQMRLERISNIMDIDPNVVCKSNRTDYVKGTYTVTGNVINFTGEYCDENYNNLKPMCDGTTDYVSQYNYKRNGSFLIFDYNKNQTSQIWLKPE